MAIQTINIGTTANDGTGDPLRTAFNKVNQNFSAVTTGLTLLGTWNASTNTPTLTDGAGTNGTYYVVSVAGSTTLGGISSWAVGDYIIRASGAWTKFTPSAQLLAGDGTAAAPSISFAADTNTGLYRIGADVLGVTTNGAERLRVGATGVITLPAASPGIKFGTRNANLNDYEEGNWTPIYTCSTTNPTVTHFEQTGRYTKIGNLVYVQFILGTNAATGGSGTLLISGLPFPISSPGDFPQTANALGEAINFKTLTPRTVHSASVGEPGSGLRLKDASATVLTAANLRDGASSNRVRGSFVYRT